jgi:hypothetical protein
MNPVEESHQDHLRITLSSVSWTRYLGGLANFDDDQEWHNMTLNFI